MIRSGTLISRLLALALAVAALAGLVFGIALQLAERWAELQDRRAHALDMAARLGAVAATREARAAELEAVERAIAGAGLHLEAETPALAGARLGEVLRETVGRHGAELRSVRVLEGGEADREAGRVGLNVALRGHWAELFPVLHAIEAGEPYLFVRAFTISARDRRRAGARQDDAPLIEMQLELYGHLPPEAAGAAGEGPT